MKLIKGKIDSAPRVLIFGPPGVGKSTWACAWPGVLALDGEDGLDQIGPVRVKMRSFDETLSDLREACAGGGEHRTVVIDTLDSLERRAVRAVCAKGPKGKPVDSLADFGYGDGFTALVGRWRELQAILESARDRDRAVVMTAHMRIETIEDPVHGKHGAWVPQLDKRISGIMIQWSDAVLHAHHEAGLVDGRLNLTGERKLITSAKTGVAAKNRWGLPDVLPLDYAAFAGARVAGTRAVEDITQSILALAKCADALDKAAEYINAAGADRAALLDIEKALQTKLEAT